MNARSRTRLFPVALVGAIALLQIAAPVASARGWRDRDARREVAHRHAGPVDWHRSHPSHVRPARRAEPFYCRPCEHRFRSRSAFYGHLHHHHHLPLWAIPFAVVHWAATWTYYG